MRWVSNGDPPIYVWDGDSWYDQKFDIKYTACLVKECWISTEGNEKSFKKKTKMIYPNINGRPTIMTITQERQ